MGGAPKNTIAAHVSTQGEPVDQSQNRRQRVAIVDDNEWVRRGRAAALLESGLVENVTAMHHAEALAWGSEWACFDAVLLDAYEDSDGWDRFTGVRVAQQIRKEPSSTDVRIVVVTGHDRNDLLRMRFAEAGADSLFGHQEVRDPRRLGQALFGPINGSSLSRCQASRVNEALATIGRAGVEEAFIPGRMQKQLPLTRRQLITLRQRLSRLLYGPGSPPPWRSIVRAVNKARGVYDAMPVELLARGDG
jgi:CheY-like chemotaxis protein